MFVLITSTGLQAVVLTSPANKLADRCKWAPSLHLSDDTPLELKYYGYDR